MEVVSAMLGIDELALEWKMALASRLPD